MIRFLIVTLALLFTAAAVQAENIRGMVKSVDANGSKITVMVGNTERTVDVAKNVRVFGQFVQGRRPRRQTMATMELSNGMNALQPNNQVLLTTVPRDGQEQVTEIRIEGVTFGGGRRR